MAALLQRARPVLLDGAVGTEISRRGIPTALPLWSAHALESDEGLAVVRSIHEDYARAGAEILVTNTFRTTSRALAQAGCAGEWRSLNRKAVECARDGARAAVGPCLVAGGIAPLEDCYRPDLVPTETVCLEEHRAQSNLLASLGVDLILIETMNSPREARAAVVAARESGLEILVSLCPGNPGALLSGEPLAAVVPDLVAAGGDALRGILLNCSTPESLAEAYPGFARISPEVPHGVYAHLGAPLADGGWTLPVHHEPARYAAWIEARLDEGARLVGGCCGTTPAHIAALRTLLESRFPGR